MVSGDLATASEALASYRDSLVTAEARMAQDRDKMAQLQDALRRLQSQMIAPGAELYPTLYIACTFFSMLHLSTYGLALIFLADAATGSRPDGLLDDTRLALPPLMSDAAGGAGGMVGGASRVHFLYFLSSLLLLKTALSQQGRMSNVAAQVWHEGENDMSV